MSIDNWAVFRNCLPKRLCAWLGLFGTCTLSVLPFSLPTIAQIVPDQTLGSTPSLVQPGTVNGLPALLIQGGAAQGVNLFQSFQQFNVGNGQQVYFENPSGIQTILTRVTGSQSSQILGTLGVLGNANLFLLNPNGIYFGPNARLDIKGSFVASTAEKFVFPNGAEFSATNPQAPPLLTVNVPIGVQFGNTPGTITNQGNLSVGRDLTLSSRSVTSTGQLTALNGQLTVESFAGNVQVQNLTAQTALLKSSQNVILDNSLLQTAGDLTVLAQQDVRIWDNPTVPVRILAGGNLLIQGNNTVDIQALQHPDSLLQSGQDLTLRSDNPVIGDARFLAGQAFRIEQLNGTAGTLISPNDPIILAVGNVKFGNYIGASLHILAGGSVDVGTIGITGIGNTTNTINPSNTTLVPKAGGGGPQYSVFSSITLSNGTTFTIDGAQVGTLDIRAGIDWSKTPLGGPPAPTNATFGVTTNPNPFSPAVTFATPTLTGANIRTGAINVSPAILASRRVYLTNQYFPNTSLSGDITTGTITGTGNTNSGADVVIDSRGSITTRVNVQSSGTGRGGNITLLSLGNIILPTPQTTQGLLAQSFAGQGGRILVQSQGSIFAESNIAIANSSGSATLPGNDITIQAKNFFGNRITITSSNNSATGQLAGNISILVDDTLELLGTTTQNSTISSNVPINNSAGSGGSITLQAGQIRLLNTTITSTNAVNGTGSGGPLVLLATNGVTLDSSSLQTQVSSGASGPGGPITLTAGSLSLNNRSSIRSSTAGSGPAGNVSIQTTGAVTLQGQSFITSQVNDNRSGTGGNITIAASDIALSGPQTEINSGVNLNASGKGGTVRLTANTLSLTDGAQVTVSTAGSGAAGDIYTFINNNITISGANTGLFANTTPGATGASGNIFIDPILMVMSNGATINVSNLGSGIGGNVALFANTLRMNNASIVATSLTSTGGNILIQVPGLLLMQNGSQISATSGTPNSGIGNGGNITMNTGFLVGAPNQSNRITANAFLGRGGNIRINTQAIFGFVYRPTDPGFNSLTANKITASSTFGINGIVTITTPGVDPSQGLGALPTDLFDASRLVSQGCPAATSTVGRFVVTGKGGLPASPGDVLADDALVEDTRLPGSIGRSQQPAAMQPAQKWAFNDRGEVTLLNEATTFKCYER